MRTTTRKLVLGLAAAVTASLVMGLGGPSQAAFPEKSIRLIVPYKAGGGTDSIARGIATAIEAEIDQAVVVTNITGGSGATGMISAIKSDPDGYTVLFTGSSDLNTLLVFKSMSFGLDSFQYVGGVYETPTWILSHKDRGLTNLGQIIDAAKAAPNKVTVGVGGKASAHYTMAKAIIGITDAPIRVIAFDGGASLKKALIANEVNFGIIHSPVLLNEVRAGLLNVVGTGGGLGGISYEPVRGTKTLRQYDIPIDIGITRGLFLPKDTPQETVDAFSAILEKATNNATFADFGAKFGFAPKWVSGPDFRQLLLDEQKTYRDIKANYIDK